MKRFLLLVILLNISLTVSTNDSNFDTTTGSNTFTVATIESEIASLGCTVKTKTSEYMGIVVCRA